MTRRRVGRNRPTSAFPHEDGEGFNLLFQAMPLDGKIVLRTYKEDEEEEKVKSKPHYKQEVGSGHVRDTTQPAVNDPGDALLRHRRCLWGLRKRPTLAYQS